MVHPNNDIFLVLNLRDSNQPMSLGVSMQRQSRSSEVFGVLGPRKPVRLFSMPQFYLILIAWFCEGGGASKGDESEGDDENADTPQRVHPKDRLLASNDKGVYTLKPIQTALKADLAKAFHAYINQQWSK